VINFEPWFLLAA